MKFTVSSGALMQALNITGKCLSTTKTVPAAENFLFHIKDNVLTVVATDMENMMSCKVSLDAHGVKVNIQIPGKALSEYIKSLPECPIHFEAIEREVAGGKAFSVTINAEKSSCTLPAEDGKEFPLIKIQKPTTFDLPGDVLYSGIEKTLFASGNSDRPVMNGVNLVLENGGARFTATNAYMLSTFYNPTGENQSANILIPTKLLQLFLASPKNDLITVSLSDKHIKFQLNEDVALSGVLNGERFINYEPIIPTSSTIDSIVDRKLLKKALKRVSGFSDLRRDVTVLSFKENKCLIRAEDKDYGKAGSEEMPVILSGGTIDIGFDAKMLIECLDVFETEEVHLLLNAENKAMVIKEKLLKGQEKENLVLIMPKMILS